MEIKQSWRWFGLILTVLVVSVRVFSQDINYDRTLKRYVIAEFVPNESIDMDGSKRMQIQREHLQYIQLLAQTKKLVLAGPYTSGGGIFILNTTEEEKAKEWMEADPAIKNRVNTYVLKQWMTEKGLFTLDNTKSSQEDYGTIHPNAPKETLQYGQLTGKWDVAVSNLTREGTWIDGKATWVFKYAMGGYAIQDFWTRLSGENKDDKPDYFGSNIRIYNPKENLWKTVWLDSGSNNIQGVWTSYQNASNEIVLHDNTEKWEIKFYNITQDSFDWKWDFKLEDGTIQTRVKIKAKKI